MGNNKYKESKVRLGLIIAIVALMCCALIYCEVVAVKDSYGDRQPAEQTYVLETPNGSTSYKVKRVVYFPNRGTPSVTYYCEDGIDLTFTNGGVILRDNVNGTTSSYSDCDVYPEEENN